jgi:hypothetical protein
MRAFVVLEDKKPEPVLAGTSNDPQSMSLEEPSLPSFSAALGELDQLILVEEAKGAREVQRDLALRVEAAKRPGSR